jgi:8-oxo-dGTP pyrophosphatase MutT (NUDIX family)
LTAYLARTLNDIDPVQYTYLIEQYGTPKRYNFSANFQKFECDLVRRSSVKGRHHDITCFIPKAGGYVAIQKHDYANTGIYRAPSGGAKQGESLVDAAKREMLEETGLEIELERFVLDMFLEVRCSEGIIPWRSLVFLAKDVGGVLAPIDTREIYDVIITSRNDMLGTISQLMKDSGWGGFEYRAFLTAKFFETLDSLEF